MVFSGSDVLCAGLDYARRRVRTANLSQMDATRMPFFNEFDVICAFDVIEHIEADTSVLAEMHRATKPGGGIVLTVPQHKWLWSAADDYAHHVRRYSRSELTKKVKSAGFEPLIVTSLSLIHI